MVLAHALITLVNNITEEEFWNQLKSHRLLIEFYSGQYYSFSKQYYNQIKHFTLWKTGLHMPVSIHNCWFYLPSHIQIFLLFSFFVFLYLSYSFYIYRNLIYFNKLSYIYRLFLFQRRRYTAGRPISPYRFRTVLKLPEVFFQRTLLECSLLSNFLNLGFGNNGDLGNFKFWSGFLFFLSLVRGFPETSKFKSSFLIIQGDEKKNIFSKLNSLYYHLSGKPTFRKVD